MPSLTLLSVLLLAGMAAVLLERTRHAPLPLYQPVRIEDDPVEPTSK